VGQSQNHGILVGIVTGFYLVLRWYVNNRLQMHNIMFWVVQMVSLDVKDDILKDLLKKMTRTYPSGALNIESFPALTKCPVLHAILSYHTFESRSACCK
jgi:hypothetical protein